MRTRFGLSLVGMLALAALLLYGERSPPLPSHGAAQFPNVWLTNQHGQKVRLYDDLLKGKAVAVNTFFAGCAEVCPLGTAKMLELQKLLGARVGRDIFFYSISIDPVFDTPAALKAYAERYGAGPGWMFLTGSEHDIQLVTRKLGLGALTTLSSRDRHSTTLMVGNESTGQWMRHSATDNPVFLAASMETFLGWPRAQPQKDYTHATPLALTNGHYLFRNACSACHTIGGGDKIGPDLLGVHTRREPAWLRKMILQPDAMLESRDPAATALLKRYGGVRMPNLGLSEQEVSDILDHIAGQDTQHKTSRSPAIDHAPDVR